MTDPDEQFRRYAETRNRGATPPGWDAPRIAARAKLFDIRENLDLADINNRNALCDVVDMSLAAPVGWQFRGVEPVIRLGCHTVYTARYSRIADGYAVECEGDTAGAAVVRALKFVAEAGNEPTLQLPLGDTDNG